MTTCHLGSCRQLAGRGGGQRVALSGDCQWSSPPLLFGQKSTDNPAISRSLASSALDRATCRMLRVSLEGWISQLHFFFLAPAEVTDGTSPTSQERSIGTLFDPLVILCLLLVMRTLVSQATRWVLFISGVLGFPQGRSQPLSLRTSSQLLG